MVMLRGLLCPAFLICFVGCSAPQHRGSRVADVKRWVCYYGEDRGVLDAEGVDMFVLDAASIGNIAEEKRSDAVYLAYMCVGEAETYRWYWPEIKGEEWLIQENPSWPQHYLVDPRSAEWRTLMVDRVAPRLLEKGYDGFMLDTLDTVQTLVSEEALKYEGSASAMVRLVRDLRERYPDAVIVANGGLSIFRGIADYIDGVIREGVRWRYDFQEEDYRPLNESEREWVEQRLQRVRKTDMPIFALDYVDPDNPEKAEDVAETLRDEGYIPFISGIDLNTYPGQESGE